MIIVQHEGAGLPARPRDVVARLQIRIGRFDAIVLAVPIRVRFHAVQPDDDAPCFVIMRRDTAPRQPEHGLHQKFVIRAFMQNSNAKALFFAAALITWLHAISGVRPDARPMASPAAEFHDHRHVKR